MLFPVNSDQAFKLNQVIYTFVEDLPILSMLF